MDVVLDTVTEDLLRVNVGKQTYTVHFTDYPALQGAPHAALENIIASPTTLRWPDLDVDIALDALENPEQYPLLFDHEKWQRDHPRE